MANIKRVGDKKYRIVYDVPSVNGRPRQQKMETLSGVTKQEAEVIRAKRIEAVRKGDYVHDTDMAMSDLFEKFMATRRRRLAPTSIDRYTSLLATYLMPELGAVKVASLRKAHLIEAFEAWRDRGGRQPSGRTIKHAFDLLRATLNWAVRCDYATSNVAAKIAPEDLPRARKPESRVLTEVELRQILAEAKNPTKRAKARGTLSSHAWFYPAVAFAAYTGARRGEVLALRWSGVNLDEAAATIRESLAEPRSGMVFKEPKNGRARTITLGDELVAILRSHRAAQAREKLALGPAYRDQDLVFALPTGEPVPPWNFGVAFQHLVDRTGVTRITLHDLRDTHASLLAKAGVSIEVVSSRLGHSSIGITVDRYLTVYKDRDAAAARAFDRLVG
jgi:integrase